MLIALIVIQLFAISAHASDDCNSLLSDHLESAVHDLAKLRVDLDLKNAAGESSGVIRALSLSFSRKYAEILDFGKTIQLTQQQLDQKLESYVLESQKALPEVKRAETKTIQDQITLEQEQDINVVAHLAQGRSVNGVVTLPDRRILLSGGTNVVLDDKHYYSDKIEIFDPATNQITYFANHLKMRKKVRTVLSADGQQVVLWEGDKGEYLNLASGEVLPHHLPELEGSGALIPVGLNQFVFLGKKKARLFDLSGADPKEILGFQNVSHLSHSVLSDRKVVFSGGCLGIALKSVQVLDPVTLIASEVASLLERRYLHSQVTLHDDSILVLGGVSGSALDHKYVSTIERLDLNTKKSVVVGKMLVPRTNAASVLLPDGRVVTIGGQVESDYVHEVEIFDPDTGVSELIGTTLYRRQSNMAVSLVSDREIVIIGGDLYGVSVRAIERIKIAKKQKASP